MPIAVNDAGDALYLDNSGAWQPAQTAQNPQTGAKLAFDGQSWSPLAPGSDPNYTMGDVGDAALRGVPIAGGLYERNESPENQARAQNFDAAHPYISGAAKVAGGAAAIGGALLAAPETAATALGLGGETLAAQMGLSAASGAGISGADALARGTDVKDAMETGGALGLAGPVAGKLLGSVAGGVKNAVAPVSRTPQAAEMVGKVPVPLDAGQAGGDIVAQRYLDQAQKGTLGPGAQKEIDAFRANQAAKLDAAKQGIGSQIGGAAATPLDAAATAQQGVADAAAAGKQAYQMSYDNFANTNGVINAGAFQGLGQGIKTDLATAAQPKTVDDILTPASSKMVQHLDNVTTTTKIQNRATPATVAPSGPPPTVTGVSLQGVDQVRKQLLDLASNAQPGSNDQRVARSIISSFDQKIQDAVGSNLYSGDPNALGTLQQARRLYANYQQTFKSQGGGDMAGQVVEKMLGKQTGQAASHQDVANWMYGASKIGGSGQALAVADRLQNILQPDEWQQVRQGLFSKLVDTTEGMTPAGPQKISQRIADFLNGSGEQLSKKMYTPQERALINQYGQVQARMVPKVGAVNHSGTSYSMASLAKWTANALAMVGGLHVGGPLGMAAGFATNKGIGSMMERGNTRAVLRHLYGQRAAPLYVGGMSPAQKAATIASRVVTPR